MKKLLQLTALLLACLTAVGGLAGCAQLSALSREELLEKML